MEGEDLENILVSEIGRHLTKYFLSPNERSVFSKILTFQNGQKLNVNLILSMTNNIQHHQQSKVISSNKQLPSNPTKEEIQKLDLKIKCENKLTCAAISKSLSRVSTKKENERERDNTNDEHTEMGVGRRETNSASKENESTDRVITRTESKEKENTDRVNTITEREFSSTQRQIFVQDDRVTKEKEKSSINLAASEEREKLHQHIAVEIKNKTLVQSQREVKKIISFHAGATTQQSPLSTEMDKDILISLQTRDKSDKGGQNSKTSTIFEFDRKMAEKSLTKIAEKSENVPTFSCGQCSEVFNMSSQEDIEQVCHHVAVGIVGGSAKSFSAFFRYFRFRVKLLVKPFGGQVCRPKISAETVVACAQCPSVDFKLTDNIGIINHLEECCQKNGIKLLPNFCIFCDCRVQNYRQHLTDCVDVHFKRLQAMSTFGCIRQTESQTMSNVCKLCRKSYQNSDPRLPEWLTASTCDDCILSTAQNIDKKSSKTQVIFCNFCRQGKYGFGILNSASICVDCFDIFDAFKTVKNGMECFSYVRGMLNELVSTCFASSTQNLKSQILKCFCLWAAADS